MSLCTPLFPAHLVLFRLHLALAGSPSFAAESSSLYYGLPVRFRLFPTPHRCDAVSFSFGVLAFSDTDFHRAVCAPSRAHRDRRSQSLSNERLGFVITENETILGDAHLNMQTQNISSSLNLVEFGGVSQVKQPINLRCVPSQAAGEFRLLDSLFGHRLVHAQLGAFQRRWPHGFLSSCRLTGDG